MQKGKTAAVLEDLVKINNDRVEGYEKAMKQTEDEDLKMFFSRMLDESRQYREELNRLLDGLGGERETDSTVAGKIYRTWMDVKVSFGGKDRHSILASCEFGEDAAQKSYRQALEQDLPANIKDVISRQQSALKASHDRVRHLRDIEAVNR
ncbi:PA2169 family four-helix-bundle protein [Chitinophaga sp. XS-30]|uniref:PA2169 family four-helix-bundle protein n=1 Tax=Chitinophaga sp. XS-30 TaxID=2604421 RepID=UPI0011DCD386|nr:PA2169 family four-helix-bundle protein [Chitinophaga sp. XS-30]QEH39983.1 PA2169 family four-helix-bundle protein [Chitinophaga sp. XS-30]